MNPTYHPSIRTRSDGKLQEHCKSCPVTGTGFFGAIQGKSKNLLRCLMEYGKYKKRHILFQEGNPATRLFAVKSGFVKAYKTHPGGREQIIDVVKPGEVLNLEGLYGGKCTVTAEVLTDSEICFFESKRLLELTSRNSALAIEVIKLLSDSLAQSQSRLLDFGTKPAKVRLAAFLIALLPARTRGPEAEVQIPISRREVADLIGVRLETASRLFHIFKQQRIVSVNYRSVKIRDLFRLRELTE